MVAYSFKPSFVAPIRARTKQQTIRLPRKRHARPGEAVQLYVGMRTRACQKIVPDPVCVGVDEVRIDLRALAEVQPDRSDWLANVALEVNGIPVRGVEADDYAVSDGFGFLPGRLAVSRVGDDARRPVGPFEVMIRWWMLTHGPVLFNGVAIRWEDQR